MVIKGEHQMGLLDSVLDAMNGNNNGNSGGAAAGAGLAGLVGMLASNPQVVQAVMGMLSNDGGQGGLAGLIAKFQQAGLGEQVQSWVGSGENLPVSGAQMEQALGGDTLSGLATQMGTSEGDAAQQLSQLLPELINKFTPTGQAPAAGLGAGSDLMGMLGGLLGGR
jgi:uncharacterized protein YidB (DUF937 family)